MTADRHAERAAADWTAADWLIALTDAPDDGDLRARFADWLVADPANPADWKTVARAYRALGAVDATAAAEPGRPAHRTGSVRRVGVVRRVGAVRIAAGLGIAIAACLMLFVMPSLLRTVQADFSSGTAEIRRIDLADGSVVRLAPESAIAVELGADARQVELLDGIAYFDVAPDPARPFSVTAGRTTVTAVGTAFEVRRVALGGTVAVREGVVEVAAGARTPPARLEEGEVLRLSASGAIQRGTVVPGQVGLWADKLVTARARPVSDLVAEIRRYYSGLVLVRGGGLADQPATGIFDVSDPAAALALIAASQGAKLHRVSPWILVLDGG